MRYLKLPRVFDILVFCFYLFCMLTFLGVSVGINGLIIAALAIYISFKWSPLYIIPMLVFANDDLGTIIFGKLSFYWLIAIIVLITMYQYKDYNYKKVFLLITSTIFIEIFSVFLNYTTTMSAFQTTIYVISFGYCLFLAQIDESNQRIFLMACSLTVVLLSLHVLITGGVVFLEDEELRRGILGCGIGDPNYSSFKLMIGILATCFIPKFSSKLKILLAGIILASAVYTVSITCLLAAIVTLAAFLLIKKGITRKVKYITLFLMLGIVCWYFLNRSGLLVTNEYLKFYIERIQLKISFAAEKNLNALTTSRSSIWESYYNNYYKNLPVLRKLIGMNQLEVNGVGTHNSFFDIFIRFGILGGVFIVVVIIRKLLNMIMAARNDDDSYVMFASLAMICCIFYSFTLSMNFGPVYALWWGLILWT